MLNNKDPKFYAKLVSMAYVEYLIRQNGDNIYKHELCNMEVESQCLSSFLEGYYQEGGFSDFERICLYGEMLDLDKTKSGCKYKIGSTHYLKVSGINKLNDLMDDYIEMMTGQEPEFKTTYH